MDGVLYLDRQQGIAALDDRTGATRWTWTPPTDEESAANLTFGSGVVIIATTVRGGGGGSGYYGLYAVDTHTGAQRWKRPWGDGRRTVEVEACFAPLLGWVLSWWAPGERRLALALDATTLGERFSVLALCVVYRGCAVPVAWTVVRANRPGAWRPHWERLLRHLQGSVPASWVVVVLADRGLYAPWLFEAIVRLGWHPGLRVNGGAGSGLYRLPSGGHWRPLAGLLCAPGSAWCGEVFCFRNQTVRCTFTIYGAPFIVGDRALFCHWSAATGKVGSYTLTTGATVWERDFAGFNARDGADIRGADTQRIYLGVGEAGLAALRASDGATVWSHDPLTSSVSDLNPFAVTATSVYAWVGGGIAKFDAASGAQVWSQSVVGSIPVLIGDKVYLSRQSPDVAYALDAATGAIRWRFPAALMGYIIRNGVLFARLDHNPIQPQLTPDTIYALNATTGALYWKRDLPSSVAAGPFLEP